MPQPTTIPRTQRNQNLKTDSEIAANCYGVLLTPPRMSDSPDTYRAFDVEAYIDGNKSKVVLLKLGVLYRGYFQRLSVKSIPDGSAATIVDVTVLETPDADLKCGFGDKQGASPEWSVYGVVVNAGAAIDIAAATVVGGPLPTRERVLLVADKGNASELDVSMSSGFHDASWIPLTALQMLGALPIGPASPIWVRNPSAANETIYILQF